MIWQLEARYWVRPPWREPDHNQSQALSADSTVEERESACDGQVLEILSSFDLIITTSAVQSYNESIECECKQEWSERTVEERESENEHEKSWS